MDFLEFIIAAKYTKDFDTNETLVGDLWSPTPQLGSPGTVEVFANSDIKLRNGERGDSKDNPRQVGYSVTQFLSSDAILVRSEDLSGSLHVKFPRLDPGKTLDAAIIVDRGGADGAVTQIRNLSLAHEHFVTPFSTDRRATILFVDPRWFYDPSDTTNSGEFEIWIEDPCADMPGEIVDVATVDDLINAVKTTSGRNTVRIAEGTYRIPSDIWEPFVVRVCLLVDGLTVTGAGRDQTILELDSGSLIMKGEAPSLRNMTIRVPDYVPTQAVWAYHPQQFSMCNVKVEVPEIVGVSGVVCYPAKSGQSSVSISNCDIAGGFGGWCFAGIRAFPGTSGTTYTFDVAGTSIAGFRFGVYYDSSMGILMTVDCANISGYDGRVFDTYMGYGEQCK